MFNGRAWYVLNIPWVTNCFGGWRQKGLLCCSNRYDSWLPSMYSAAVHMLAQHTFWSWFFVMNSNTVSCWWQHAMNYAKYVSANKKYVVFTGRYLPGNARPARPLDGSVESTIGQDRSCVATRLIISTWWGGSSGERQTQSARWIFKRDKGNAMGSSKFCSRGSVLLWSHYGLWMLVIRAMPQLIARRHVTES